MVLQKRSFKKKPEPYPQTPGANGVFLAPSGIGKTTTAHLTAKEAGYTFIEFNASDSRSKKLLDKVLGESSDSCSMDSYLKGNHKVSDAAKDKHCIIMDEVDGMAGNEGI